MLAFHNVTIKARISTGTRDVRQAELQKSELEAKLLLGIRANKTITAGPAMPWLEFREEYRSLQ